LRTKGKKQTNIQKELKRLRTKAKNIEKENQKLELVCSGLKHEAAHYALLCRINEAVNKGMDQQELFNMVTRETKKILQSDGATFYLLSKDKKNLILQQNPFLNRLLKNIGTTFREKIPTRLQIVLKKGGLYNKILSAGKPVILNDAKSIKKLMSEFTKNKVLKLIIPKIHKLLKKRSVIVAPLTAGNVIIGLMDISREKRFTRSDLQKFKALSEQLSAIILHYRANMEKEKAEILFRQFVNSANEGFILFNASLDIVDINEYMLRQFNLKKPDILGTNIADLLIDTWESGRYEEYNKVLLTGIPYVIEDVITTPDYSSRHLTLKAFRVGTGLGMIIQDITLQKDIERALNKSKQRYHAIVDDQTELICRFTPNMKLTFVNSAYCEYFKKTREQLIGRSFMELIHKEDRAYVAAKIAELNKDNTTGLLEERIILPHGNIKWQQWVNRVLLDEKNNIIEYQSVGRDITEYKMAQKRLIESEDKYRHLVEQSLQGIIVIQDFKIVFANQAFADISGYRIDELRSMKPNDVKNLVYPDDQELVWSRFQDRLAGKQIQARYEYRGVRKDGSVIWIEMHAARIDFQGRPAIQGTINDITERYEAIKQLRLSLQEKEALLREIHHRVKNNLQIVSSILNLQTKNIKDDEYKRLIRDSQNRIKSMVLVHEKLYQTKDMTSIKPREYLETILTHLFHVYNVMPDSIILDLAIKDFPMDIDIAIPCGLIVNELISNALKYAFPGLNENTAYEQETAKKQRPKIFIKLSRNKKGVIELIVSDNGKGFPEHIDFQKTETLGLQLVGALVKQLNGDIKMGKKDGTKFIIRCETKTTRQNQQADIFG
jgi:PAS domain S-box-containing protein